MTRNNYSIGILLIVIAIVLLLGKLGVFAFLGRLFWPLLVLALGLVLHGLFYMRLAPSAVVVPGGILVTYSLLFLFCNLFGWDFMRYLWPGFIFGIAVGLYELHLFDRNTPRGVYAAAIVLAIISAAFFAVTLLFSMSIYIVVLILIVIGCGFLFWRPRTW